MISFDIPNVAVKPRGKSRVVLRPIEPPIGLEKQHERILADMLVGMADFVRREVIPAAAEEAPKITGDAAGDRFAALFRRFAELTTRLSGIATDLVSNILNLSTDRHTDQWLSRVKSTLGIDLAAVISKNDLNELVSIARERNAALITKLSDETRARIAGNVYDNITQGGSAKTLAGKLTESFGFSRKRAKLIARDQTAKFNSDLTKLRQEQAGIDSYEWSTSGDERVRPTHRENDGKIFRWDTPPERTGHPGHDIQCRCVALAVVEWDKK